MLYPSMHEWERWTTDSSERWRCHVAWKDELDLEAAVIEEDPDGFEVPFMKQALRMIDLWAVEGTLQERVGEIREVYNSFQPQFTEPFFEDVEAKEQADALLESPAFRNRIGEWHNLMAGVDSPDPEQRQMFEDAFSKLEKMGLAEAEPILRLLLRAKKHGGNGRPPARPPWRNVHRSMELMRELMADGVSKKVVAERAARKSPGTGTMNNRIRYFVELFEKKQSLRE